MKQLLITIAAVVLVGCGESQQSAPSAEAKPVEPVAEVLAQSSTSQPKKASAALTHWMTKSSGVRHNQSCRWFKRSNGKLVSAKTGRACKVCGG